jgi:predicted transcriptional regulator
MQVSEIMHKGITTVQINDSLKKVAAIMKRENIGAVPVYKNERPVGFVTDRDIVVSCVANGQSPDAAISLAMTSNLECVYENQNVQEAAKIMKDKKISRLLVVDKGDRPVGMLALKEVSESLKTNEIVSENKH